MKADGDTMTTRREYLASAYLQAIGYDPFADDPMITEQEVENALIGHALEVARAAMLAHLENWHADEWPNVAMHAPYLTVCAALEALDHGKVTP